VKKRYYSVIDKLESWKIEVMNRPVLDEVSKIKQLNLAGEAEEYFERWRKMWDEVVTADLPNVEEWLFDAEEQVEKLRLKKAKEICGKIENSLTKTEEKINEMIEELNKIIDSEEKNRQDLLDCQEIHKRLKKYLLAHRHIYGNAANRLDLLLNAASDQFQLFEDETNKGNYLTAREILLQLKEDLQKIEEKMEKIPFLMNECYEVIPSQMKEIKNGIAEMRRQGYYLEHLGLESELESIEKQVQAYQDFIDRAEIEETASGIDDIKESLNLMYDLLEGEVLAKKYIKETEPKTKQTIEQLLRVNDEIQADFDALKESYHLNEEDRRILAELDEKLDKMKKALAILLDDKDGPKSAYSAMKDNLFEMEQELTSIGEKQKELKEMLTALRKDEMEAREKVRQLRRLVKETKRKVERSNVPGIPFEIDSLFMEAMEAINDSFRLLEERPLVMPAVQNALEHAEQRVKELTEKATEMIENVYLIERIIQYGNRYRRNNLELNESLKLAENAFRRFDYQLALEEAAAAVEKVEPGAIKRIERILNEEMANPAE
jgi:Septation ring formation regulator, EzrA.